MRGFEHVLVGVCGGHGEFNAAHADAYDRGDLQQALANAPTGGFGEACPGEGDAAQGAEQHIGHGSEPQPQLVGAHAPGRGAVGEQVELAGTVINSVSGAIWERIKEDAYVN